MSLNDALIDAVTTKILEQVKAEMRLQYGNVITELRQTQSTTRQVTEQFGRFEEALRRQSQENAQTVAALQTELEKQRQYNQKAARILKTASE